MADKRPIQPGPIGVAVAYNVERLRESQNLSYAELSRRLTQLGRPIAPLGLTRIRERKRRVDVDDLVAFALALGVSPTTLLLPPDAFASANGEVPVTEGGDDYTRRQMWNWLIADAPLDEPESMSPPSRSVVRFRLAAVPDGVGQLGFLQRLWPDHVEPLREITELLPEHAATPDGDDDGHD